jgi:hypothetical protein
VAHQAMPGLEPLPGEKRRHFPDFAHALKQRKERRRLLSQPLAGRRSGNRPRTFVRNSLIPYQTLRKTSVKVPTTSSTDSTGITAFVFSAQSKRALSPRRTS